MKGIPVLLNGDPLRRTFVFAYNYQQFRYWCMFSQVNPNSRNVRFLHSVEQLMGVNDLDLVYTGDDPGLTGRDMRQRRVVHHHVQVLQALGVIKNVYVQNESCEIDPDVQG